MDAIKQVGPLPVTSNKDDWTEDEAAAVEAAGLVFTYPRDWNGVPSGSRVLAPRAVVQKFLHTVERTKLDPLARQIYCIPRLGRDGIEWSIQTAIDGFRVIAERSRQYAGQEPVEWLTEKGEWVDVFVKALHGAHPLAARVSVHRKDWDLPLTAVATWDEYAQYKRDGALTEMWQNRGPGQLAKCGEALALRKAFPQDLSGIYTDDEMGRVVLELEEVPEERVPASRRSRVQKPVEAPTEAAPVEGGATTPDAAPDAADGDVGSAADGSELFACARCGDPGVAVEEGAICEPCEVEVEAEIAAEAEAESGRG